MACVQGRTETKWRRPVSRATHEIRTKLVAPSHDKQNTRVKFVRCVWGQKGQQTRVPQIHGSGGDLRTKAAQSRDRYAQHTRERPDSCPQRADGLPLVCCMSQTWYLLLCGSVVFQTQFDGGCCANALFTLVCSWCKDNTSQDRFRSVNLYKEFASRPEID